MGSARVRTRHTHKGKAMLIGILQTGHAVEDIRARHGDYDAMFHRLLAGHGLEFRTWNVVDMEFPDGPDAAEGWLITGSKHGAYEDHPFIAPLEALIRDIADQASPLIGVCFGHQIIAQALGGKVEKFSGGWSVGRADYDTAQGKLALNAWHQDQVVELPPGAEVLGGSAFCANAILAYGDRIWTIQPHPEFDAEIVQGLVETRGRGIVPDALLEAALESLPNPVDQHAIGAQMAQFFLRAKAEVAA